jgi:hypothetical protein
MAKKSTCTCGGRRTCDRCITDTYVRESKPVTHPLWAGKHPMNPGKPDDDQRRKRRVA